MKPDSLGADRQCVFDGIKTYLSSLPVMKALMAGIPFRLYIAAEDVVIGIVFVIYILAFLLLYSFRGFFVYFLALHLHLQSSFLLCRSFFFFDLLHHHEFLWTCFDLAVSNSIYALLDPFVTRILSAATGSNFQRRCRESSCHRLVIGSISSVAAGSCCAPCHRLDFSTPSPGVLSRYAVWRLFIIGVRWTLLRRPSLVDRKIGATVHCCSPPLGRSWTVAAMVNRHRDSLLLRLSHWAILYLPLLSYLLALDLDYRR
jgi:hypothetical protein